MTETKFQLGQRVIAHGKSPYAKVIKKYHGQITAKLIKPSKPGKPKKYTYFVAYDDVVDGKLGNWWTPDKLENEVHGGAE
jgi:hypothetical protein